MRCLRVMLIAAVALAVSGPRAGAASSAAPRIDVRVDPRVELMSTVFLLAGNPEYNMCQLEQYGRDFEDHFAPFLDHPAVQIAAGWHRQRGVAFDASMSLAAHLTDARRPELRVPLDPRPPQLDSRYPLHDLQPFLAALQDFVVVSDFEGFLRAHQPLYEALAAEARGQIEGKLQLGWFGEFFGTEEKGEFHLVVAMLNGPCNYGAEFRDGETREVYCLHGAVPGDQGSRLALNVPIVVHEFCHSYANPIIEQHAAEMEASGQLLFLRAEERMMRNAYGHWETMLCEYLVRASVIRYLEAHDGPAAARAQIAQDRSQGFIFVQPLADLLAEYESNRSQYATLDDFAPRLVAFFDSRAGMKGREPVRALQSWRGPAQVAAFAAIAAFLVVLAVRRLHARRAV